MPPEGKTDFSLKETKPNIGGGRVSGSKKLTSTFDLVEQSHFLFVKVVKARVLPINNSPFVEIKIGNYKGTTKHLEKNPNNPEPEWNQVFAFRKERIQTTSVDISVREKELINDDLIGKITISVSDIPTRVPPDGPLAPQWYQLKDKDGRVIAGAELMLVIWFGTQADEAFPDASHSDASAVSGESLKNAISKVYLSPKLWYLRVNIIEGQDLVPSDPNRTPEVYVKATLGNMKLMSKVSAVKSVNPKWNEDLMFVAAEPFDPPLILTVEDKLGNNKEESLGRIVIPLKNVTKRNLPEAAPAKWYDLEKMIVSADDQAVGKKEKKFASKLYMRISLDGGYHVFDESIHCSSDYRATHKALWRGTIGVLELGIISASGLVPMKLSSKDGVKTTDAYCVAKYGPKWVRTRTVTANLSPKWNEQYTWDIYEPYTVLIIGVFDNCHLHGEDKLGGPITSPKDPIIGKLRIRLSTLSTNRIYTYSYPLIALHPSGAKKMGEIQLAVRFTCPSNTNLLKSYTLSLFPAMHQTHPLSVYQLDRLRLQAVEILCSRLERSDPPLRKEVVECILGSSSCPSQMWSWRRGRANFERLKAGFNVIVEAWKWLDDIRKWKNPVATCAAVLLLIVVIFWPDLILPTMFVCFLVIGIWQYWNGLQNPRYVDVKLSHVDSANADELDEELDTFPSSREGDVLRMRYDRLRNIAGRGMVMAGELATQGERFTSLLTWQDPRATAIFLGFCLVAALILAFFLTLRVRLSWSPQWILSLAVLYICRLPILGYDTPSVPHNLFRRLPTKTDCLL